ncbi:MAG: DUF748 domain-containing protein, partial [Kangiellaceae bacterium]|nr:DUF748 domain-containing protein [Kangiellaceae bacterium]
NKKVHPAVSFNELQVTNSDIVKNDISVESLKLNKLKLLESLQNEGKYLANNKLIKLDGIKVTPQQILVDTVDWQGFVTELYADSNGINVQKWFAQVGTEADTGSESKQNPEAGESNLNESNSKESNANKDKVNETDIAGMPIIQVNNFMFAGNSTVSFTDANLTDPVEHKLSDIQIEIKDINLGGKEASPATIDYKMTVAEAGRLSGKGNFALQSQGLDLNLDGKLKAIDMTAFSQYAARFIGYRIDSGQLNIDYGVKLANNQIDANFKTLLEKFEVGDLQAHEQSELNEELGVPLPMALNLLRDSDDNIELEMPIDGDVNSPDFSLASIISAVSVKAIKNAVIYHYSPLGMFSLASGVFDLATALRFDPIKFEASATQLNSEGKEQLDKVIQLMTEKPKVKMVICGIAVQSDIQTRQPSDFQADSQNSSQTKQQTESQAMSKQEVAEIIELAKQRQSNVIDYISAKNIDKSRLVGCNVKVDDEQESQARVEISI